MGARSSEQLPASANRSSCRAGSEAPSLTARIRRRHTKVALSALRARGGTEGSNPFPPAESAVASIEQRAEPRYPALTAPARPRIRAREKGDNQLHRARVLEVRIHLPPAESPCLTQTRPLQVENRAFRAGVSPSVDGAVGGDAQDRAI